jgi:hypothetical protein
MGTSVAKPQPCSGLMVFHTRQSTLNGMVLELITVIWVSSVCRWQG